MSFSEKYGHEDGVNASSLEPACGECKPGKETKEKTSDSPLNTGDLGQRQMSRDEIEASLAEIVDGIEDKRRQDLKIVEDAVKEIMAQAKRACETLEQNVLHMHASKSQELDRALSQLVLVLDDIKKAEADLNASRTSLNSLCQEIQGGAFPL